MKFFTKVKLYIELAKKHKKRFELDYLVQSGGRIQAYVNHISEQANTPSYKDITAGGWGQLRYPASAYPFDPVKAKAALDEVNLFIAQEEDKNNGKSK